MPSRQGVGHGRQPTGVGLRATNPMPRPPSIPHSPENSRQVLGESIHYALAYKPERRMKAFMQDYFQFLLTGEPLVHDDKLVVFRRRVAISVIATLEIGTLQGIVFAEDGESHFGIRSGIVILRMCMGTPYARIRCTTTWHLM